MTSLSINLSFKHKFLVSVKVAGLHRNIIINHVASNRYMETRVAPSSTAEKGFNVSFLNVGIGVSKVLMPPVSLLLTSRRSADVTLPPARRPRRQQRRTQLSRNSYSVKAEAPSSRPRLPPMSETI